MKAINAIHDFSKNTEYICVIIASSIILILMLYIAPLNISGFYLFSGKVLILSLLIFALIKNTNITRNILKSVDNILTDPELSPIKLNMYFSYFVSLSILILAIYVLISFFK